MGDEVWVDFEGAQENKAKVEDSAEETATANQKLGYIPGYQTEIKWTTVAEVQRFKDAYERRIIGMRNNIEKTTGRIERFKEAYDTAVRDLISANENQEDVFETLRRSLEEFKPPESDGAK